MLPHASYSMFNSTTSQMVQRNVELVCYFCTTKWSEYKFNFHEGDNAAKNERETDEGQDNGTTASVYLKV